MAKSRRLSKKMNECTKYINLELIAKCKQKQLKRNVKSAKLIKSSR